jgi:hypothetical protein
MKTVFLFLGILAGVINDGLLAEEVFDPPRNSLIIDPKMRALDYQQAFETLRKEKPSNKVCITLMNGSIFSHIIEMQKMANSTLFLIRYNSPQGIKVQAVELELIKSIGYLE